MIQDYSIQLEALDREEHWEVIVRFGQHELFRVPVETSRAEYALSEVSNEIALTLRALLMPTIPRAAAARVLTKAEHERSKPTFVYRISVDEPGGRDPQNTEIHGSSDALAYFQTACEIADAEDKPTEVTLYLRRASTLDMRILRRYTVNQT